MEMIHGDFKVGESCRRGGVYACVNCTKRGRQTRITLEKGRMFPFCGPCREEGREEVDILWRADR